MSDFIDFARKMEDAGASARVISIAWECIVAKREGRPWPAPAPDVANDRCPRMSSSERSAKVERLVGRDGYLCAMCKCTPRRIWRRMGIYSTDEGANYTKVHPTDNIEVDHKLPLWAGGDNGLDNLWLLCIDCHKVKTAKEAGERRRA